MREPFIEFQGSRTALVAVLVPQGSRISAAVCCWGVGLRVVWVCAGVWHLGALGVGSSVAIRPDVVAITFNTKQPSVPVI